MTLESFMANTNIYIDICTEYYNDDSVVNLTTKEFIEEIYFRVNVFNS